MASSDPSKKPNPGPWPPPPESKPMPPTSWAKRTGFRPKLSGEANAGYSGPIGPRDKESSVDLELGRNRELLPANGNGKPPIAKKRRDSDDGESQKGPTPVMNGNGVVDPMSASPRAANRSEEAPEVLPQIVDEDGIMGKQSHMKYGLRDTPGLV